MTERVMHYLDRQLKLPSCFTVKKSRDTGWIAVDDTIQVTCEKCLGKIHCLN